MKQNKMKKLTKLTSTLMAGAMVFSAIPLSHAAAAEATPAVTVDQKVTNQTQQII